MNRFLHPSLLIGQSRILALQSESSSCEPQARWWSVSWVVVPAEPAACRFVVLGFYRSTAAASSSSMDENNPSLLMSQFSLHMSITSFPVVPENHQDEEGLTGPVGQDPPQVTSPSVDQRWTVMWMLMCCNDLLRPLGSRGPARPLRSAMMRWLQSDTDLQAVTRLIPRQIRASGLRAASLRSLKETATVSRTTELVSD